VDQQLEKGKLLTSHHIFDLQWNTVKRIVGVATNLLDPLMYSLMDDPVILPSSRISIDRATIRSHINNWKKENCSPATTSSIFNGTRLNGSWGSLRRCERSFSTATNLLDPLMYSLMDDPVILPSSRISIDRATEEMRADCGAVDGDPRAGKDDWVVHE
jgi:hypothetical protein